MQAVEQGKKADGIQQLTAFALHYYGPQAEDWDLDTLGYRAGIALKNTEKESIKLT